MGEELDPQFRPDVVAGKYNPQLFDPTGAQLLVNEMFYSLQGEGDNAGKAAVFLRLAKCNLACKFCDTEFETGGLQSVHDIVTKITTMVPWTQPDPEGTTMGHAYTASQNPWVVLSGGEPALQNCGPLITLLHAAAIRVAIETSGSVWAEWMPTLEHICVSPKVPLDRVPLPLKIAAHEFKWIVNTAFLAMYDRDPSKLYMAGCTNYLQPESLNPKWTLAASKLVMAHPSKYKLSLQTHKLAGNP